jgi:DNA repair exonuclease SbcCD ATPase subunit
MSQTEKTESPNPVEREPEMHSLNSEITVVDGPGDTTIRPLRESLRRLRNTPFRLRLPSPPPPSQPSEEDLAVLSDDLEQERCRLTQQRHDLEEERQRLRGDEEALMKQMREMEVAMAREREEMARQRTELQRLHAELQHKLDQLQCGDGEPADD